MRGGAGRGRYKQISIAGAGGSLPAGTETTVYVGGLFEKVTKPSGVIEYKHYLSAGGDPVAMHTLRTNGINDTRYLHKDHLGSVDTITDEFGAVVLRLSFDAFGKRRGEGWAGTPSNGDWTSIAATTHRGFTYHEQLDTVDLVHMNGRVYDPALGRFISADPTVQAPFMSQSLNRYSYSHDKIAGSDFEQPSGWPRRGEGRDSLSTRSPGAILNSRQAGPGGARAGKACTQSALHDRPERVQFDVPPLSVAG